MPENETREELHKLLSEWKLRLYKAQIGHYISTEKYLRLNSFVGIPLVTLSTFVSVSLFLGSSTTDETVKNVMFVASIVTAILASLQTFLRPSEKAELHRVKAARYGALKRHVELYLAGSTGGQESQAFLNKIRVEWNHVADDAPVTSKAIRSRISSIVVSEMQEHNDTSG